MRRLLRTLGTLPLVLSQADLADTIRLDELPCGHLPAGRRFFRAIVAWLPSRTKRDAALILPGLKWRQNKKSGRVIRPGRSKL